MIENKQFQFKCVYDNIYEFIDHENGKIQSVTGDESVYDLVNTLVDLLNKYADENEQLKQRNKRQAEQLSELYKLIAKKNWGALTKIIDDLCSCEVALENELKCYELHSCSTCEHAILYIPYYTFPYSDPYCIKGHGKCGVNKSCKDYKMTTAICGKCKFIKVKDRNTGFICTKHNFPVSFNGKTCDEYIVRDRRVRE